jgi:hypothetical protein
MRVESQGGLLSTGENRRMQRETYPSATSSTTDLTWNDPSANLGLRGERPVTNRLSQSTAADVNVANDIMNCMVVNTLISLQCCR